MKLTKEDRIKIVKNFDITERTTFRYQKEKEKWLKAFLLFLRLKDINIKEELEEIEALTVLCCKNKEQKETIKEKIKKINEALKILE